MTGLLWGFHMRKYLLFLFFIILLLSKISPSFSGTVPIYGDCGAGAFTPVARCDLVNTNPGHYPYIYSVRPDGSVYFQCNDNTAFGYHGGGYCNSYVGLCSAPNTWSNDYSTCNTPPTTCTLPQVRNPVTDACYTPPACTDPSFPLLSLNTTTGYKTCTSACSITDGAVCYPSPSQSYCDVNGSILSPASMCRPTCDAGTQWYNAVTNKCDAQTNCTYPLKRDPVTNSCVTDPISCGSTSHVDPVTGQCELNPLVCHAAHTHANATNDACVPDPPLNCPIGQHDDGTYQCVADAALACTNGQQRGFVDGILQCVPHSTTPEPSATAAAETARYEAAKAAAAQAAAAAAAAQQQWLDDMNALADAQGRLDSSPGNTQFQQDVQAAQNAANASSTAAQAAKDTANAANGALTEAQSSANASQLHDDLSQIAKESTLQTIDERLTDIRDGTTHSVTSNGSGCDTPPSCTGDPVQCAILRSNFAQTCQGENATQEMADAALGGTTEESGQEVSLSSLNTGGFGLGRSCPAPRAYRLFGAVSLTIDISSFCTLAEIVGYLLLMTASFISIRIVSS